MNVSEIWVISSNISRDISEFRNQFNDMIKFCSRNFIVLKNGVILNFHSNHILDGIRNYKYYGEIYNYYLKLQNKKLQQENKELQSILDKAIKYCKQEISASSIQYGRTPQKQLHLIYKVAHERILNILEEGDEK